MSKVLQFLQRQPIFSSYTNPKNQISTISVPTTNSFPFFNFLGGKRFLFYLTFMKKKKQWKNYGKRDWESKKSSSFGFSKISRVTFILPVTHFATLLEKICCFAPFSFLTCFQIEENGRVGYCRVVSVKCRRVLQALQDSTIHSQIFCLKKSLRSFIIFTNLSVYSWMKSSAFLFLHALQGADFTLLPCLEGKSTNVLICVDLQCGMSSFR